MISSRSGEGRVVFMNAGGFSVLYNLWGGCFILYCKVERGEEDEAGYIRKVDNVFRIFEG